MSHEEFSRLLHKQLVVSDNNNNNDNDNDNDNSSGNVLFNNRNNDNNSNSNILSNVIRGPREIIALQILIYRRMLNRK